MRFSFWSLSDLQTVVWRLNVPGLSLWGASPMQFKVEGSKKVKTNHRCGSEVSPLWQQRRNPEYPDHLLCQSGDLNQQTAHVKLLFVLSCRSSLSSTCCLLPTQEMSPLWGGDCTHVHVSRHIFKFTTHQMQNSTCVRAACSKLVIYNNFEISAMQL